MSTPFFNTYIYHLLPEVGAGAPFCKVYVFAFPWLHAAQGALHHLWLVLLTCALVKASSPQVSYKHKA